MTPIRTLSACLLALAVSASAQTYTAGKIQFSQLGSFTQQQLEDAAGMHAGLSFTAADLGAAAQRLVDTGYFDEVSATLDGNTSAITVKFEDKPIDTSRMLHVGYANFIWLTHAEIEAAIRAKFPLFIGYLPESSPHVGDIKAALAQALAAKSVNATVGSSTFDPTLRHPVREVGFYVVKPSIRVASVNLAGVTPALVPLVQKSVNATARTPYTEGPADLTSAGRILAPLLDAGYIQATLTEVVPTPSVLPTGDIGVALAARLDAGEIYHVSGIAFAGTPVFAADTFTASAKLHAGDVASRAALLQSLEPIDAAYRRKGYMDVVVDAAPTLDPSAHTVAYTVNVQPGEIYHVHEITTNNLDAAAQADFDRGFLMKAGEPYNAEYMAGFLKNNTALHGLQGYSAGYKAYADPNTHTVDLVIDFVRAGR